MVMKYDIIALKNKMLVKYPFFGTIIASVHYVEDENIKTAETDGKMIYYNPFFLEKLEPLQQTFVLAHEVCHIAFNHISRSFGKDMDTWNIATDAVINQFLKRDGLEMTNGAINIPQAINYDAEQLYEKLLKDKTIKKHGHDTHSMWVKVANKDKQNNNQSNNQNISEKEAFKKNLEEKKKILEEFKKSIINDATNRGTTTNSITRRIDDIGITKPLIDWRYVLKETIKYEVDYSYKNATIEDGVVTANLEELPIAEVEIVLDTSGSINEDLLKNFLRECKNILMHSKLKIGCFDTKFYGFNEIKCEKDIDEMKFIGGGGTDFNVAVRAFTRCVANKIIFTDGEAPVPNISCDAIWLVFSNKTINPKGGKVIYINKEELIQDIKEPKVKKLINYK